MLKTIEFLFHQFRSHLIFLLFVGALISITFLSQRLDQVQASYGSWGDAGYISACLSPRGLPTILTTGSCLTGETQAFWIKDVDAGSGLTATHDSNGVTLSLTNAVDGWSAAEETWTYATADAPTYTFTISGDKTTKYSPGMRLKLTQTTTKYFLVTGVAYSSPNTTMTVYGGTDYSLADAAITTPYYSLAKAPQGFPLDPNKWTVTASDNTNRTQESPTGGTWYNLAGVSLNVPIGAWVVSYKGTAGATRSSAGSLPVYVTLSTANNSESDADFTLKGFGNALSEGDWPRFVEKRLTLTSKTTYYYNTMTDTSGVGFLNNHNAQVKLVLKAVSAYL